MAKELKYDFEKEWDSLKKEMNEIRSRLDEIDKNPEAVSETLQLLNRLGEQQEKLEAQLRSFEEGCSDLQS